MAHRSGLRADPRHNPPRLRHPALHTRPGRQLSLSSSLFVPLPGPRLLTPGAFDRRTLPVDGLLGRQPGNLPAQPPLQHFRPQLLQREDRQLLGDGPSDLVPQRPAVLDQQLAGRTDLAGVHPHPVIAHLGGVALGPLRQPKRPISQPIGSRTGCPNCAANRRSSRSASTTRSLLRADDPGQAHQLGPCCSPDSTAATGMPDPGPLPTAPACQDPLQPTGAGTIAAAPARTTGPATSDPAVR